jgi:hypothetical protein
MNNTAQRSAAVMASGVIAILGSLVTAIGILIGMMGLLLASRFPNPNLNPNPMDSMPGLRVMTAAIMAVFFAVTIWGAFSGVGIIRLRNWARISVLVWSGIAAPMCAMAILFVAFMPMPPSPNPTMLRTMIHVVTVLFYGGPLAIAVWWLILFTRPKVVAQFKPVVAAVGAGSGDPFGAIPVAVAADGASVPAVYAVPAPLPGPSVPLPIIVLACFFLLSSLSVFFIFFMHMPAMFFGHAYTGLTGSVIYVAWCLLYAISGVGMLRRVSWAYSLAIGLQIVGIVSGIMTVLSPNFDRMMQHAMSSMRVTPSEMYEVPSMTHLRGFSFIGLLFPVAILGLLVYYRPRFLEACAAKTGSSSAPGDSTTPGNFPSQAPPQNTQPLAE